MPSARKASSTAERQEADAERHLDRAAAGADAPLRAGPARRRGSATQASA